MIDYVSDWQSRLRARIYWQFKGKPKIQAWVDMVARQFADLEDAYQSLLTLPSIDDSAGAQLDLLGRLVGQLRGGVADVIYRQYLRAAVVAKKSGGRAEDIYKVFAALFSTARLRLTNSPVKQFKLTIDAVALTWSDVTVAMTFMRRAKEAGAGAVVEWAPAVDNLMRWDVDGAGWDTYPMSGADRA